MLEKTDADVDASVLHGEVSVSALDRTDMAIALSTYHHASSNNCDSLNQTDIWQL